VLQKDLPFFMLQKNPIVLQKDLNLVAEKSAPEWHWRWPSTTMQKLARR
jgi:hypothetical protein